MAILPINKATLASSMSTGSGEVHATTPITRAGLRSDLPLDQRPAPPFNPAHTTPQAVQQPFLGSKAERDAVVQAIGSINQQIQVLRRELRFSVDESSEQVVIKVVDSESGDVIRQIPPEEVLALARDMSEGHGRLLDARA